MSTFQSILIIEEVVIIDFEEMSNPSRCVSTSSSNAIFLGLLVGSGYNLAQTMAEGRDKQSSHITLESFNYPSSIVNPRVIEYIADDYCIRLPYRCGVALPLERTCNVSKDLYVFKAPLLGGFRLPPQPFIFELFFSYEVHPVQITRNSWKLVSYFIVQWTRLGLPLSVNIFRRIFLLRKSDGNYIGWVNF
ncbi:hypothetical protein Syun_017527 [Stephania yunnanensis]|uniref:Transposase (putative) gypsy type domain-containing protein n=1 Tax=Stephania yunnanensis TaxID=152371 RepID=A0AAP0J8S1_9MAGN